ncbi:PQQ-binding-like beta-propeller repeat protein [Chloroflexota bacterium]
MRARCSTTLLFKILLLLVILLLGVLAPSGCTGVGTIPRGWSGGVIADDTLFVGSMDGKLVAMSISDGSRLWAVPLESPEASGGGFGCAAPASTSVAIYGSPAVAADLDLVYVGGHNGKIYAFDRDEPRGEPRWVYPRQDNIGGTIVGRPVVAQGKIYFGASNGKVYALNAADGYKEWEFETGDKIWSMPAIDGDTLFIGSFDNKLYALDVTDGSKKWEFETEGAIVSTPLVDNNTVYIGSFDRHLYAVNIANGKQIWKFPANEEDETKPGNWFWAKPVIYDGTVYAASLDGKVYALDAESGDKPVVFDMESPVSSSPVLVGESIVVATQDGMIWRIDAGNKKKKLVDLKKDDSKVERKNKRVNAPLVASEGIVYIHTAEDVLYAVDAQSGAKREFNIK